VRALAELMAKIEDEAFFACIDERRIEATPDFAWKPSRDGWFEVPSVLDAEGARALASRISRVIDAGLPALFVYAWADVWEIGARLAAAANGYEIFADAWAFHVAPGHAGWAAHRGSYELADRDAPELFNVWLACTDVGVDDACMHVVPLDRDAHYPNDLPSHDFAPDAALALPVRAGSALVWNANVLHWGGRSSGKRARISITFTLRRIGARREGRCLEASRLDHRARLDLIADMVLVYGDLDRTIPEEIREWARLIDGLRRRKER
jgi:hypothetical protein